MAVPKRKTSKRRIRIRQHAHRIKMSATQPCANCGEPHEPHRVCRACGYYKGRQVITIQAK